MITHARLNTTHAQNLLHMTREQALKYLTNIVSTILMLETGLSRIDKNPTLKDVLDYDRRTFQAIISAKHFIGYYYKKVLSNYATNDDEVWLKYFGDSNTTDDHLKEVREFTVLNMEKLIAFQDKVQVWVDQHKANLGEN